MLKKEIQELAEGKLPVFSQWRRWLHQHPEPGLAEFETAAFVAERLRELGCEVTTGLAGTGVVGIVRGEAAGDSTRVVAIRADIDALPVQELNEVPYCSLTPGMMHACGHDTHTTMVLGAAALLRQLRQQFSGTVKLIFQPAEESTGGAEPLIAAGVLKNPDVDYVIGGHAWPGLPVGEIALHEGAMMASATGWELNITGRGGHGAEPHKCIDAIAIASQIVVSLQQVISRTNDPQDPAVFSVCTFNSGVRGNIIAETAKLTGTLRTLSESNRARILKLVPEIAASICQPFGATAEFKPHPGVGVTANDSQLARAVISSAQELMGDAKVHTDIKASMGAEDFCYYGYAVPACYIFIGVTGDDLGKHPLHSNRFDIDERALVVGASLFAHAAIDLLHKGLE